MVLCDLATRLDSYNMYMFYISIRWPQQDIEFSIFHCFCVMCVFVCLWMHSLNKRSKMCLWQIKTHSYPPNTYNKHSAKQCGVDVQAAHTDREEAKVRDFRTKWYIELMYVHVIYLLFWISFSCECRNFSPKMGGRIYVQCMEKNEIALSQ